MAIRFEYERPYRAKCACCGKEVIRLTRFIYDDREAIGYYFIEINRCDDEDNEKKSIKCLIVFTSFDEQGEITDRLGFPLWIWQDDENNLMSLRNKAEFPWEEGADLVILDRQESLAHPLKDLVFEIADQIMELDLSVEHYFAE